MTLTRPNSAYNILQAVIMN